MGGDSIGSMMIGGLSASTATIVSGSVLLVSFVFDGSRRPGAAFKFMILLICLVAEINLDEGVRFR